MATAMNMWHPYVTGMGGAADEIVDVFDDEWSGPRFGLRRLVAALLVGGLVLALAVGAFELVVRPGGIPASAAGSSPASASRSAVLPTGVADRYYIVEAGDSLWSIARAQAPFRDVRTYVDELKQLNGGTQLQPGQRIVLPG